MRRRHIQKQGYPDSLEAFGSVHWCCRIVSSVSLATGEQKRVDRSQRCRAHAGPCVANASRVV
ncbi:hypothetical protein CBOM_07795 [Ceraceosorus bombacis]|uniref:Uncharacterized protein n=1 Tax=Ceraceosorus bombacis TaxID=401625 RepID=A0A0P1BM31_9BASI|nr:hypothetical protein CBOM_07795 [Ceraceosorus bombacis]